MYDLLKVQVYTFAKQSALHKYVITTQVDVSLPCHLYGDGELK